MGELRTHPQSKERDRIKPPPTDARASGLPDWLKAGVLDKGVLTRPETGTPQGGVISPI